jgi:hypothetical protein
MSNTEPALTIEQLEDDVKKHRLISEIQELKKSKASRNDDDALKAAQINKIAEEIRISKKVRPLLESIKLISSLVIGIGGAVAGIAGYQFANAERKEADIASLAQKIKEKSH